MNIEDYILYPDEIWKPLKLEGIQTKYEISSYGRIKSHYKNKIIKDYQINSGYRITCLYVDGKKYWKLIHRLVASTFIDIPVYLTDYGYTEDDLEVNHKDGDKWNNKVSNLEWNTSSENKIHAYNTGLKRKGEDSPVSKYSNEQVILCCQLLEDNKPVRDIMKETLIDYGTIETILSGVQWKHISKDFDFSKRKKQHNLYDKEIIEKTISLLKEKDKNNLSFADIGRLTGMTRTSVWYLYNKHFKK